MIQHEVDVKNLDKFDWHRDMMDTYQWLRNERRMADATALIAASRERFYRNHKNLKSDG